MVVGLNFRLNAPKLRVRSFFLLLIIEVSHPSPSYPPTFFFRPLIVQFKHPPTDSIVLCDFLAIVRKKPPKRTRGSRRVLSEVQNVVCHQPP